MTPNGEFGVKNRMRYLMRLAAPGPRANLKGMKTALVLMIGLFGLVGPLTAAPAAAAEEPTEGVIPGITIERKTGAGFLGLQVVDGNFKLTYYDEEKQPVAADHPRALLRWPARYKSGDDRAMLNRAGDGTFLTSPKFVRPPYAFRLFITLIAGEEGEAEDGVNTETYAINFQQ